VVEEELLFRGFDCPVTKSSDGRLELLHLTDDTVASWLKDMAMKAFAKRLSELCSFV